MAGVMLDRLEELLTEAARTRSTLTYQQVAQRLELPAPHTIHQTTVLLEALMWRHAAAGLPQLACLVISRNRDGLPAPGFFMLAEELGVYAGSVDGDDARGFIAAQRQRCFDHASS
jgi:hypothetical protein